LQGWREYRQRVPTAVSLRIVVLVSANAEWAPVVETLHPDALGTTPYGATFEYGVAGERLQFVHGGWGKTSAAASTEYAIATWRPHLVINIGTCGGIDGRIARGETIVVTRTIPYDIEEAMGDAAEAVHARTTELDVQWLAGVLPTARRTHLVSGDRDLRPIDLEDLVRRYDAVAADWESAAIAYVASRRETPLAIVRAVSDLVSSSGGEAIGDLPQFQDAAASVMRRLLDELPAIIDAFRRVWRR
jgi:adenosylhomocysteine nucleosidase